MSMFCCQCQEASQGKGCSIQGVCGKDDKVANMQDRLVYLLKGLAAHAEKNKEVDRFIIEGLFATITNVNFDEKRMQQLIDKAVEALKQTPGGKEFLNQEPADVSPLADKDEDIRSLKSLVILGLKGLAAYMDHALVLGQSDPELFAFVREALAATLKKDPTIDELLALILKTGQMGVKGLALLDKANTTSYGHPEITGVYTGLKEGPAILVSGHDLLDLEEILLQTEGTGINVYTHGEMLAAHAYPAFKKFKHLIGNYGTAWHNQQKEFAKFDGAIVMTTNCLQSPRPSYIDRIFTTGLVAWPGVEHIKDRIEGKVKDFSQVIAKALRLGGLQETPGKKIVIGFGHDQMLKLADKVIAAVKSGAIKRFIVMAGCDGRHKEREYFTQVAEKLPKDAVILTAGCAKYRYNQLDLGDIGGIPRVLDAGQCNDSYSLAVVALKLAEAFGLEDINELPLSFDLAWYEQKAVIVLLALLSLGVKGIRLGPTLPAFVSPNVLNVLVEKFSVRPTASAENDVALMMSGG